ncbi:MAG: site-2 protease family protein, partial [Arcobacteraceae bacterium]|nr:site-2 protease family protein [Arcobacteraceae bacterium]
MGLITFLLVLSVLVFIHELGHFLAARYFGVTVHTFSIGFGKRLISKEYKGTVWQFSLIPLGGYVKMKGQDDSNPALIESGDDSYNTKKPWQRIVILFAGPFANFALAAVLYFFIALLGSNSLAPTIGKVIENSPAFQAGLQVNDEIVRINDQEIKTWDEVGKYIRNSQTALKFYVKREGVIRAFVINPELSDSENLFKEKIKKRMIGIAPAPKVVTIYHNPIEAIAYAWNNTIES